MRCIFKGNSFSFFFSILLLIFLFNTTLYCSSEVDVAAQFVAYIKNEDFENAYYLFLPSLRTHFTLQQFESRQREVQKEFVQKLGTVSIVRVDEILARYKGPLLDEANLQRFFPFWKQKRKEENRIFQYIFGNGKAVLVGVDTISMKEGTYVERYEFLPEVQQYLTSEKQKPLEMKTKIIVG